MNALAEDQLGRLRELLAGQGITFGMYVGKTPEKTADAPGKRLKTGSSKKDYQAALKKAQNREQNQTIYPPEEELVVLLAVKQKDKQAGKLTSCVAAGQASGRQSLGRYREPIREIRATTVSDVHVLSQNLIHHAERKRLLVFADNRQDAAFQAGWMQDHARRYRLRSFMLD